MKETVALGRLRAVRTWWRARRIGKIEQHIRNRKARQLAREPRRGTVHVRTLDYRGDEAIERLQTDLPRELMRWSRERSVRITDLMVPGVSPAPGVTFTAQGRALDGRVIYAHCRIGRRLPWRQTDAVTFNIMECHPD